MTIWKTYFGKLDLISLNLSIIKIIFNNEIIVICFISNNTFRIHLNFQNLLQFYSFEKNNWHTKYTELHEMRTEINIHALKSIFKIQVHLSVVIARLHLLLIRNELEIWQCQKIKWAKMHNALIVQYIEYKFIIYKSVRFGQNGTNCVYTPKNVKL